MKLGDKIYKYSGLGGVHAYTVVGIKKIKNGTLFEVESQACSHGYQCIVYVKKAHKKEYYEFMSMVTGEEDDYEHIYWHESPTYYYKTVEEARNAAYEEQISDYDKQINRKRKELEHLKKSKEDMEIHYKNVLTSQTNE